MLNSVAQFDGSVLDQGGVLRPLREVDPGHRLEKVIGGVAETFARKKIDDLFCRSSEWI